MLNTVYLLFPWLFLYFFIRKNDFQHRLRVRNKDHIDTCTEAFKDLEHLGFEFGKFGFAVTHVHFQVNVPKKYSVEDTEIILKSNTAKRMFERHPGFRKRYPKGAFWSGYEHYQSTGVRNLEESTDYLRRQQQHHGFKVIDDRQQTLQVFPPSGDAA